VSIIKARIKCGEHTPPIMDENAMSAEQADYFTQLQKQVDEAYKVATFCRSKSLDSRDIVEIPQAADMASRVHQLLEFLHERDTANQIRHLTKKNEGDREQVAIDISRIVCMESIVQNYSLDVADLERRFTTKKKERTPAEIAVAIYHGICAGLAVITEGILVAPLEGVVSCEIMENKDGSKCLSVNYAGPIRSAGGTGQAISVLLADYLRRDFGLEKPQIEANEVERYIEEVMLYHNLQYKPSANEMRSICQTVPIYITGEGVGKEVSGGRDLRRVPSNKVREGMLLVLCEGMLLKAPKLKKHTDRLKLDGWGFLDAYCQQTKEEDEIVEFKANEKYISDAVAGRPTISQPMAVGGFRLRYGRSRGAGLAATSIHPASMYATGNFIIPATQMKIERPGKATVVSPCTTIDGPYVQLKDGSAKRIINKEEISEDILKGQIMTESDEIKKVWDLGEILIPAGEFRENNHPLMPSPYVKEWHEEVLKGQGFTYPQTFEEALEQAKNEEIPIAPEYVAHFNDLTGEEIETLCQNITVDNESGEATVNKSCIELIYRLNVNVKHENERYTLYGDASKVLLHIHLEGSKTEGSSYDNGLDYVNSIASYRVKPRVTYRIGTRMAKPEKVSRREMKPPIHGIIPVGHDISSRLISDAVKIGKKPLQIGWRYAPEYVKMEIKAETIRQQAKDGKNNPTWLTTETICPNSQLPTQFLYSPTWSDPKSSWPVYDFKTKSEEAGAIVGYRSNKLKGVKGLTSQEKFPEHMAKALLRHKHDLSVFRDGTIRFDMVDMTLTHFKPAEIGLTIEACKELGYDKDCYGQELVDVQQIVEMRVQDFVAPTSLKGELLKTAQFMDDLLVRLYGDKPFYSCNKGEDLVGHLFATLAPHTSGAILCRLIGFSDIKGGYFHPYSIAGRRRNSDGDIDCVILLLDCLLNFSRAFLSAHRGGQMDAPLILTTRLNPSEIDKEAMNVDAGFSYGVDFYEATQNKILPKELDGLASFVEHRLGTVEQYEGIGFTHDTDDIADGPKSNPYTSLPNMRSKVDAQFQLGSLLVGVDNIDQSSRLLDRHLLRDMRGNIRAFGQQSIRCVKCNHSYRRPPLTKRCRQIKDTTIQATCMGCGALNPKNKEVCGECNHDLLVQEKCGGKLLLTVYPKSVSKYRDLMAHLIETYGCSDYNKQKYELFVDWLDDLFSSGNKQTTLSDYFK